MQQLLTLANKNLQKGKQIYEVTIKSLFNSQLVDVITIHFIKQKSLATVEADYFKQHFTVFIIMFIYLQKVDRTVLAREYWYW